MSIDVSRADDDALDAWDDRLSRSPHRTAFHRLDVLRVLAEQSGATLYLLVGHKGQEPVGLFPVFELTKGPVSTVFSPPPGLGVPYLGPVLLNFRKLRQRKFEKLNRRFVGGALEWVDDHVDPKFTYLTPGPRYDDARPLQWNDFDVSPRYTYELDLTAGREALVESFTRDARSSITNSDPDDYTIERADDAGFDYVLGRINDRYDEQDGGLHLDPSYVSGLREALPDGGLRVYVGRVDGDPASGAITLHHGERVSFWQGGPRPDRDVDVPINDLLHWHAITDGIDDGRCVFDFVGANTPRLCRYKSKYNPDTARYVEAERGTRAMNAVSSLYRRFG